MIWLCLAVVTLAVIYLHEKTVRAEKTMKRHDNSRLDFEQNYLTRDLRMFLEVFTALEKRIGVLEGKTATKTTRPRKANAKTK